MATIVDPDVKKPHVVDDHDGSPPPVYENAVVQDENTYAYDDSRKLGVTGAVFLILNKMIGTGSECCLAPASTIAHIWQSSPHHLESLQRPDPLVFPSSSG
jgi:hypothetical protein